MQIVKLPLVELTPDPHNAKAHPAEQIEQIKNSIKQFGNNDPIAVWGDQNLIVEGHGRFEALKALGYTEAECIRLDKLTDEERRAYALAHNQTTMSSGWLPEELDWNLDSIGDIDMSAFGFATETDGEVTEDNYDPDIEQPEPVTQPGDLFALGDHRLLCGDSTKPEDLARLMDGKEADLLLTDPPYGVAYEADLAHGDRRKLHRSTSRVNTKIENDNLDDSRLQAFLEAAFGNAKAHLKRGGAFYIWSASGKSETIFALALDAQNLELREKLAWVKNTFVMGRQDYQWRHETCFYGWKEGAAHYFTDSRRESTVIDDAMTSPQLKRLSKEDLIEKVLQLQDPPFSTTVLRENKPAVSALHPTMKPLGLLAPLIRNSSRRGELVLDPFGGSGSTLITAEQLGRICYTVELDPHYCDAIIDRWQKQTGQKAKKL